MKNTARISILLGVIALVGFLFYYQPTAEAKPIFESEADLQNNLQQQIIQQNNLQQQTVLQDKLIIQQQNNPQKAETPPEDPNTEENIEIEIVAKNFRATAYCLKGKTASGSKVKRGIVAADPRVLPLGTRIQLDAGSYSGTYTVADTGGAVRGRVLDVWVPNCAEANRFGRKRVKVSILGRNKRNKS